MMDGVHLLITFIPSCFFFFLNNGRFDEDCFLPLVLALMYQKVELLQCESRVFPGRYPGFGRFYHPLMFVYCS